MEFLSYKEYFDKFTNYNLCELLNPTISFQKQILLYSIILFIALFPNNYKKIKIYFLLGAFTAPILIFSLTDHNHFKFKSMNPEFGLYSVISIASILSFVNFRGIYFVSILLSSISMTLGLFIVLINLGLSVQM